MKSQKISRLRFATIPVPLTAAEIREGLTRLKTSAFMAAGAEDAYQMTAQFKVEAGAQQCTRVKPFELGCVIFDLAVALLESRLTQEQIFRLGTSPDAIKLFEDECSEWRADLRRSAEKAAKAEEAGA